MGLPYLADLQQVAIRETDGWGNFLTLEQFGSLSLAKVKGNFLILLILES